MARGRKPKPTRAKRLAGNPGERKLNDCEPTPAAAEPAKPGDLTELESRIWDATAEDLRALGLFHRADTGCIRGYVRSYALALECDAAARKEGQVIETPHGVKRNPHSATPARPGWPCEGATASWA